MCFKVFVQMKLSALEKRYSPRLGGVWEIAKWCFASVTASEQMLWKLFSGSE